MTRLSLPELDMTSAEFRADPCATIADGRFSEGLARSARGLELLTYDAVGEAVRHPKLRNSTKAKMAILGFSEGPVYDALASMLTSTEGPDHRRMRRAVAPWFNADTVERFRAEVRAALDDWVSAQGSGPVDFAAEIGLRLPAVVFCRIVGAPLDQSEFIARSSVDILALSLFDPAMRGRVERATIEAVEWVRALVESKERNRGDDVVSTLLEAEDGGQISRADTVNLIVTLLIASVDSTRAQLACNVASLARNKDQWLALQENPELVPGAVGELVRYNPAVMTIGRAAVEPIELRGVSLEPGDPVFLCAFTANNDPAAFDRPRELDVRTVRERLPFTFGNGRHSCLGRMVAILEQEELLRSMLVYWDDFEVEEQAWTGAPFTLSPATLRVSVTPAGRRP